MTVHFSMLRDDLLVRKRIIRDTGWRKDEMHPRYGLFPSTRPPMPRWEWRCLQLDTEDGRKFRMLVEVSPDFGKWKAMLIKVLDNERPVAILRFEDQPGQKGGGLHVHANCDSNQNVTGADSVNMPYTLPEHGRRRRRYGGWTKPLFCKAAGEFFRTTPITDQEEMSL